MLRACILVGMSRAGKSTVGQALAKKMDADFWDSDEELCQKFHLTKPFQLYAKLGKRKFRRYESELVKNKCDDILSLSNHKKFSILALGGGILSTKDEEKRMLELLRHRAFFTVYLHRSLLSSFALGKQFLARQIGIQEWLSLFARRHTNYFQACDYRVYSHEENLLQTVDEIERTLRKEMCNGSK